MSKRFAILAVTGALVAAIVAPAHAWVAARGYHGAVAVGGHRCCYHSGGAVAGAAVAGVAVGAVAGAAAASAARPPAVVYAPPPVVVVPAPVVVAPPPVVYAVPAPVAVGTVVYALPAGCGAAVINGVQYFNCGGGFYQPVYQGGGVAYQVVPAP